MKTKLKKGSAFAAVLGLTFTVGVAFAAWTANGTGSGYAASRAKVSLGTTAASVSTADLYPGSTGGLTITVNNPNPYPVLLTSVTGNGAITPAGCVTFSNQTGLSKYLPGGGNATFTLPNAVAMAVDVSDSCANVTFTVPVALSGTSTSAVPTASDTPLLEVAYNQATYDGGIAFDSTTPAGQSFTRAGGSTVTGVAVYIATSQTSASTFTGSADVKIFNLSDTSSSFSGTPLSTQTITNLSGGVGQWLMIPLNTPVSVGTTFAVLVQPTLSSTFNGARFLNPYPGGAYVAQTNVAGTYAPNPAYDMAFRVYGF
jgi:hypothetical protein